MEFREHKAGSMSRRHTTGQQDKSNRAIRQIVRSPRRGARPTQPSRRGRRVARRRGAIRDTPVRRGAAHPRIVRTASQPARWPRVTSAALTPPGRAPRNGLGRLWLLTPALVATGITATVADRAGQPGEADVAVARWWLLSMVLLLAAAGWPLAEAAVRAIAERRMLAWRGAPWRSLGLWMGMIAVAALPRLVRLDRFPTVVDGDEGAFMIRAVAFRQSELPGWFNPGFYGSPNLYSVVQGLVADLAGSDVAGHRTLSALLGAIGVVATWRLGRHLVGEPSAILGAILLAGWPLHLHVSRVALNNITDPTFLTLALLFLVRTARFRHRLDAVACGMALAFGLYGYFGGRAFPVVILSLLPVLAVKHRLGLAATLRVLAWIVAAFAVTAMPLLVAFRRNPAEFGGHMDMVSPLSLDRLRNDPFGTLETYLPNLREAAFYPFAESNQGLFRHESPYVGLPLAILLVAGAVALLTRWLRDRDIANAACLAIPWALLTAGIATTIPITGHRLLALTPVLALVAGSGVWWLASLLGRVVASRLAVSVSASLAMVAITTSHLAWMTSEARQLETYGDHRSVAAFDLGWRISGDEAARPAVLYVGAPFVWSHSFPSLTFLVEGMPMTDIEHPLASPDDVPPLPEGTLLYLGAERSAERCVVEAALPGVTVAEVRDRYGTLIYLAFYRGDLVGWSTSASPAGSTFDPAATSPCDGAPG